MRLFQKRIIRQALLFWGIVIAFIYLFFYQNAHFMRILERKRSDDIVSDENLWDYATWFCNINPL